MYIKVTVRKKTLRQDNFRKCPRCHRFSEISQWVDEQDRGMNTNSRIFG